MNKNKVLALLVLVAFFFVGGLQVTANAVKAKKKVVPGGQNQLMGTEGKVGVWLFNGTTKFMVKNVAYPEVGPQGQKPEAGKKWVAIEVEVKNAHKFTSAYGGPNCALQLVDADEKLFERMFNVKRTDWKREGAQRLLPAAGLKALYVGSIDSDYAPVRLIFLPEPRVPVYRVSL
jgi:hypothetical protein